MFLLGSADFVRRGLAGRLADGRAGHAVLRSGDPVRKSLARHVPSPGERRGTESTGKEEESSLGSSKIS